MNVRTALLEAAVAEFSASGTRGATTRRIAAAAGVNEVTLFRHFQSKSALIQAALERFVDRVERQALPVEPVDPHTELLDWARAQYRTLHRHRAFLRKVMSEREEFPDQCALGMRASATITAELAAYLRRIRHAGLATRDGWDERAAANMLFGALMSDAMGRDTVPARFPYRRREAVEWYVDLIIRAIGVRSGSRPGPRRTRK